MIKNSLGNERTKADNVVSFFLMFYRQRDKGKKPYDNKVHTLKLMKRHLLLGCIK